MDLHAFHALQAVQTYFPGRRVRSISKSTVYPAPPQPEKLSASYSDWLLDLLLYMERVL